MHCNIESLATKRLALDSDQKMNHLSQPVFQFPYYAIPKVTLPSHELTDLLVVFLFLHIILLLSCLGLLSPDTTRTPATEGRGQRKVNVLLRVETNNERRDVDNLLSDAVVGLVGINGKD